MSARGYHRRMRRFLPTAVRRRLSSLVAMASAIPIVVPMVLGAGTPSQSIAQPTASPYPSKPVKIIVPLAAGGTGDTLARLVSEETAKLLGQTFVVENRPGSGGVIGADAVAKSTPDGYTLLTVGPSHVINASLRSKLPYDAIKDFAPVALFANTASVLVVHPSVPVQSVAELIALAKRDPGKLHYGSAGNGSSPHLHAELFKALAAVDLVHVPYKGSTQARTDLIAGQVQVVFDGLLPAIPHVRAGKLRALGVTNGKRAAIAPDIPTIAEAGVPAYQADAWYGLLAPADTPTEVVSRLHGAIEQALALPALRDKLAMQGAETVSMRPAEFGKLMQDELDKWARIVRQTGAKVD